LLWLGFVLVTCKEIYSSVLQIHSIKPWNKEIQHAKSRNTFHSKQSKQSKAYQCEIAVIKHLKNVCRVAQKDELIILHRTNTNQERASALGLRQQIQCPIKVIGKL
jgi:16S rRNA U1498 N3-methylase RsmE